MNNDFSIIYLCFYFLLSLTNISLNNPSLKEKEKKNNYAGFV